MTLSFITLIELLPYCMYHVVFFLQNQFFISSLPDEGVRNAVVDHVRAKIVQAYRTKKTFRVIICVPLMPEFGGVYTHQIHI